MRRLNPNDDTTGQTGVLNHIRTDLSVRRNDNYGCERSIAVGSSRGGGGIPYGDADAMRALIRFNLSNIYDEINDQCTDPVGRVAKRKNEATLAEIDKCGFDELTLHRAILQLTLLGAPNTFDQGSPTSFYTIDVHRLITAGSLSPFMTWIEGNGREAIPYTPEGSGCEHVDPAFGVAWDGADSRGDANNQSAPEFDREVVASSTIQQAMAEGGEVVEWDITPLVSDWLNGTVENHGLILRDPTSDGWFRGIRFGAREGLLFDIYPDAVEGPKLVLEFSSNPK